MPYHAIFFNLDPLGFQYLFLIFFKYFVNNICRSSVSACSKLAWTEKHLVINTLTIGPVELWSSKGTQIIQLLNGVGSMIYFLCNKNIFKFDICSSPLEEDIRQSSKDSESLWCSHGLKRRNGMISMSKLYAKKRVIKLSSSVTC